MKKKYVKLALDVIMTFVFVMLLKKNLINMSFHEIAGIGLCVLFILHKFLNLKWILSVSKNLFKKETKAKVRVQYIVDVLLLIDMLTILVTGIGINKTISKSLAFLPRGAQPIHMFASALAIILIGIHLGLHWNWIKNTIVGKIQLKSKAAKIICKTISLIILGSFLGLGAYTLYSGKFRMWIASPFVSFNKGAPNQNEMPFGDKPDFNGKEMPGDMNGHNFDMPPKDAPRFGDGKDFPKDFRNELGGPNKKSSATAIIMSILQSLSLLVLFTTIAACLNKLFTKKEEEKLPVIKEA